MAVLEVTELFNERETTIEGSARWLIIGATRTFQVQVSEYIDGPVTASIAVDPTTGLAVPLWGEQHPEYMYLSVKHKRTTPIEGEPCFFKVECHYEVQQHYDVGQGTPVNPCDRPWECTVRTQTAVEVMERDVTNWVVANSAGDAFSPPIDRDVGTLTLVLSGNQNSLDVALIRQATKAINLNPWWGFAPKECRIDQFLASSAIENGIFYWRVSAEIGVCKAGETWDAQILDRGLRAWFERNGAWTKERIFQKALVDGVERDVPIDEPVNLDGAGHVLPEGAAPFWLTLRRYVPVDFVSLGLPAWQPW